MLRSVIYTSHAARGFTDEDLAEVLTVSRANNIKWHLSGMLLSRDGSFLQVLEGPVWPMARTLARIEADPRHGQMTILCDQQVEARVFGEWTMASDVLDAEGTVAMTTDAVRAHLERGASPEARVLIETFLRVTAAASAPLAAAG